MYVIFVKVNLNVIERPSIALNAVKGILNKGNAMPKKEKS